MTDGNVFHGKVDFGSSKNAAITGTVNYIPAAQTDQLLQLIAELQQRITAHERELADPQRLRASAQRLEQQLHSHRPKRRLRELLNDMTAMAGSVTAVGAAIDAVRGALYG